MTFEKIKEILVENLGLGEDEVTLEADIQEDLGADSLDIMEIVICVKDEFDITIEDDEIQNMNTVADLVNYIDKKN
ncbi:MAG: acyl carrier protein [Clostridia bacterium]